MSLYELIISIFGDIFGLLEAIALIWYPMYSIGERVIHHVQRKSWDEGFEAGVKAMTDLHQDPLLFDEDIGDQLH